MDLEPPSRRDDRRLVPDSGDADAPGAADCAPAPPLARALADRLDRPVVLVGMMGVGKSSLGRKLAAALGWPFIDADDAIETAAQMTIPEIFAKFGEASFRDGERRVIARLLAGDSVPGAAAAPGARKVIATGGGAFVNAETRALILGKAVAVWLDAEVDTLVERTARKDNRPLLKGGDPREILGQLREERARFYAEAPVHVRSGNAPHARTLAVVLGAIAAHLEGAAGAHAA